jgi:uncharacterized phage protein gp47/JayE
MAIVNNPWVGYIDRSYQQVKASLLNRLVTTNPEITDHSESNILIIIIGMFAGLVEMLNYYIDNMAREAFLMTCQKFESAVKIVKLLDYRIKARYPETVDLLFSLTDGSGNLVTVVNPVTISKNTQVTSNNGVSFLTLNDLVIPAGSSQGTIGASQTTYKSNINLGTTSGAANQIVNIGVDYQQDSMSLLINGEIWTYVPSFALSKTTDKHFLIDIDVDAIAKITFGDGVNGAIPLSGYTIYGNYQTTLGPNGKAEANTISTISSPPTIAGVNLLTVNNPSSSSGGAYYEGLNEIRKNAPLSIRTLNRAVTRQDYKDLTVLAPGVSKADVKYCCGKKIDIYIAPTGGGLAQSPLINNTTDYLEGVKMITTKLNVQAAGETDIYIKIAGQSAFRVSPTVSTNDIHTALTTLGSNQDINGKIRLSDIYLVCKELSSVDYINIVELYPMPYARPSGHLTQLNWTRKVLPTSTTKNSWKVDYNGTTFRVFKNNNYLGTLLIGQIFTDIDLEFTILGSSYTSGMVWNFTSYPFNTNIELDDFTVPIMRDPNIVINIDSNNSNILPNTNC